MIANVVVSEVHTFLRWLLVCKWRVAAKRHVQQMNIIAGVIILGLFSSSVMAQSDPYRLGRIRRVERWERFGNKPAIEIEVVGPQRVGGLYNCLRICKLKGIPESTSSAGEKTGTFFQLRLEDWKKLRTGNPIWFTWGCMRDDLYEKIKPLAYLDKKSLIKQKSRAAR